MGWTFNTVDPNAPTDGPKISAVAIAMTTLAMVAVILRVYVRQFMVKAFGSGMSRLIISLFPKLLMLIMIADDWVIVYAWVSSPCHCFNCSSDRGLTHLRLHLQVSPFCLAFVRILPFQIQSSETR